MTSLDPGLRAETRAAFGQRFTRTLWAYVALTKPRIIELLLITTVPTMFLAQRGVPPLSLILLTLIGGTLAAASANTLNCVYDRDIDAIMGRTAKRPLVTGEITPRNGLIFGLVLGVLSVLLLGLTVNWLSAWLALAANAFYVVIYTMLLKRRTPQNIVWGGAAGCMPVLIGWSAVTNSLTWEPWILFMVIFLWTPPHYWPLSLRFVDDYENAGVPMLPVVQSPVAVVRQIVAYSWAMVGCSLILIPVGEMGLLYSAVAVISGGYFIFEAHQLAERTKAAGELTPALKPMRLFHASITYLTVLFIAVGIDPLLPF